MGAGAVTVELVAAALAKPYRVEPVAGLPLAEPRAREQPVDEFFVGVWGFVIKEQFQLLGRGGQPREIEEHPPGERGLGGLGSRGDPHLLLLSEDEAIDVVFGPPGRFHLGRRHGG